MKVENRIELFIRKEKRNPKMWEVCPKSDFCNINKCPLHEDFKTLQNDSSDFFHQNKERCISKSKREKIREQFEKWTSTSTLQNPLKLQRGNIVRIEKNEVLGVGR